MYSQETNKYMLTTERNELFQILYLNYDYERNNKEFALNNDLSSLHFTRGKLTGFCMALYLNWYELDDCSVTLTSQSSGKVLYTFKPPTA